MISDPRLLNSLKVTFILAFGATALEFFFGLGLALALMVETKISPILRGVLIMIAVTPSIVAAYIWRMLFNPLWSPLNYILHNLFNFPEEFEWTSNVVYALPSIILVDFWQWTPFMTLVLLAGLFSLRLDVQEAARVDGASKWQTFRYIIFPLLKPLVLIVILIRFMDAVKIFDILYILTKGGPGTVTETISFYTFVVGFNRFSIGYAAALSWVALFMVEIISIMFIFTLRRE
jgi:multiple sugar transport system permease protein